MKLANYFKSDLIFSNINVEDRDSYFDLVSDKAESLGFVKDEFKEKVKLREVTFPTGIQLETYGIAIPHTDAEYVNNEFIAVATFKEPVEFNSMEDSSQKVNVKLAFMLGLNQPHSQLEALQQLMQLIQDKDKVEELISAKSSEELEKILNK